MNEPLGLHSGTVVLAEHDARWPALYRAEAARIAKGCPDLGLRFEHVGSTAIPGLPAKPVLDLLVGRPAALPAEVAITKLVAVGYEHRGDLGIPGREFFRRGEPRAYHLHVVALDGSEWCKLIAFRDCLLVHPQVAQRYGDLKRKLAARYPRDRERYLSAKAQFIEQTVAEALRVGGGDRRSEGQPGRDTQ